MDYYILIIQSIYERKKSCSIIIESRCAELNVLKNEIYVMKFAINVDSYPLNF